MKKKTSPRSTATLTTLDDFLKEEGKLEKFEAIATKEVPAPEPKNSAVAARRFASRRSV